MNTAKYVQCIAALAGTATAAFAAGEGREDGSSLAICIFLGFCALIIIAQLLPIFRIRLRRRHTVTTAREAVPVNDREPRL